MLSISVLIYNILFFLYVNNIHGVNGASEPLCERNIKCSSIVDKAMQVDKPLSKEDYAYLVVKFENIDDIVDTNTEFSEVNKIPLEKDNNNLNNIKNKNKIKILKENGKEKGIEEEIEEETVTFLNKINTNPTPSTVSLSSEIMDDLNNLQEGEYGDEEIEEEEDENNNNEIKFNDNTYDNNEVEFTTTAFGINNEVETETVEINSSEEKLSLLPRHLDVKKRNETIVEQRFSQFFVPVNEYSVLKLRNVPSKNWESEYIYVGLVHNKKVYYTHFPLLWASYKGCVESRSVTITLEDGNYKNIEWGYTSCRGKSCEFGCLHDRKNDEDGDYKRCIDVNLTDDNKCDVNIYIGWAGTDKDGHVLLDSAQSIYNIKNFV